MMVIGLTGKACAGKNQYAEVFAQAGCKVIDVDLLGHDALEQSKDELLQAFGAAVFTDGRIDRKALGALVFSNPEKLQLLESITHPKMVSACKAIIDAERSQPTAAVILNAALLKRMGLVTLCDRVLFIDAPLWLRFLRCRKRESLSWRRFLARERAQKDITFHAIGSAVACERMRNSHSKRLIHRQVATYCATIGIKISHSG
ncbi:MAG: dephospho-CoA kinase [Sphaerochaeta sp.]|uniref:dephospho-CoA kinase n=1 Tax=Sphaerochaeta sp. TaxID=1972642 RepID=UPI003D0EF50D